MPNWDIFHTDRLEAERNLSTEAVRAAVASGAIRPDDFVRPAGSQAPWARVGDMPALSADPTPTTSTQTSTTAGGPSTASTPKAAPPPPPRAVPPAAGRPAKPRAPSSPPRVGTPPPPPADRILDAQLVSEDELEVEPVFEDDAPRRAGLLPDDRRSADRGDRPAAGPAAPPPPAGGRDRAVAEDRTVELPGRPTPPPAPTPTREPASPAAVAAGAGAAALAGVGGGVGVGTIPPTGPRDRGAGAVVEPGGESLTSPELFTSLFDPADEDEEAAAFTLAAEPAEEPDEIDLTAMVDVAFQLVLFFLVTATTLYFKTLEIPTPDPEDPDAVAQQMRTLDDLLEDYILVEIDPQGRVSVDREPVDVEALTERLRQARADTLRTGMLLMADFTTPHRSAIQAIDSANALDLKIAIARPPAPSR